MPPIIPVIVALNQGEPRVAVQAYEIEVCHGIQTIERNVFRIFIISRGHCQSLVRFLDAAIEVRDKTTKLHS